MPGFAWKLNTPAEKAVETRVAGRKTKVTTAMVFIDMVSDAVMRLSSSEVRFGTTSSLLA